MSADVRHTAQLGDPSPRVEIGTAVGGFDVAVVIRLASQSMAVKRCLLTSPRDRRRPAAQC